MDTPQRSIAKALSWRAIATLITSLLVFALTGQAEFAAKVGLADTLLKLVTYFAHERLWNRIPFGRPKTPEYYI